jgi:hypothetical protein
MIFQAFSDRPPGRYPVTDSAGYRMPPKIRLDMGWVVRYRIPQRRGRRLSARRRRVRSRPPGPGPPRRATASRFAPARPCRRAASAEPPAPGTARSIPAAILPLCAGPATIAGVAGRRDPRVMGVASWFLFPPCKDDRLRPEPRRSVPLRPTPRLGRKGYGTFPPAGG